MGGLTLQDLFAMLYARDGTTGLRMFFGEVCADTPAHRTRLQSEGPLRHHDLALDDKLQKHFHEFTKS